MTSVKTLNTVDRDARQHLSEVAYEWLATHHLLTADEVGEALGITNPGPVVRRWREQGKLVGIRVAKGYVYPALQLDVERGRIRPEVARENAATGRTCWEHIEVWASAATILDDVEH